MSENTNPQFVVPGEEAPSCFRRLFRRTLYLRLLDGEFVMWCYETGLTARHASDELRHQRVIVSDTQAFSIQILKAMNEVGVGSVPGRSRMLILHNFRFHPDAISPTEKYALYEMWKNYSRNFWVLDPNHKEKLTDSAIVTLCREVGTLKPHLKKI